jgi:hypothetical protein
MELRATTKRVFCLAAVSVLTMCVACNYGVPPVSPTRTPTPPPPPPAPPNAPVTVSGTVREFSGSEWRPAANLRLRVRALSSIDGAVGGQDLPDIVTDGGGRYTVADVTAYVIFLQTAPDADQRFMCDWFPVHTSYGGDVPVVPRAWTGPPPSGMWRVGASVEGHVAELLAGGATLPVANAIVTLENGSQDPPATTDARGFYMICSIVGADQFRRVTASKPGYADQTQEIFSYGTLDFTLIRR